jgi:curved DNA-binding protein CbpA
MLCSPPCAAALSVRKAPAPIGARSGVASVPQLVQALSVESAALEGLPGDQAAVPKLFLQSDAVNSQPFQPRELASERSALVRLQTAGEGVFPAMAQGLPFSATRAASHLSVFFENGASQEDLGLGSGYLVKPEKPLSGELILKSLAKKGPKSYYDILELPKTASAEEIKHAYRQLAFRFHPDVHPGDPNAEKEFKRLNEAHSVLSDPEKRRHYDAVGGMVRFDRLDELVATFVQAKDNGRGEILRTLAHSEAWPLMEDLVEQLGGLAPSSADAFRALAFVYANPVSDERDNNHGIAQRALEHLADANATRPETAEDFRAVVLALFAKRVSRREAFDHAYQISVIVAGFFNNRSQDPSVLREWFPLMNRMLIKGQTQGWSALTQHLEEIADEHPALMKDILSSYIKATRAFLRLGHADGISSAHGFDVARGLVTIARLRPEYSERVLKVLLEARPIFASGFGAELIRLASTDQLAFSAVSTILSQPFPPEDALQLKDLLEREYGYLRKSLRTASRQQAVEIKRNMKMLRATPTIGPTLR